MKIKIRGIRSKFKSGRLAPVTSLVLHVYMGIVEEVMSSHQSPSVNDTSGPNGPQRSLERLDDHHNPEDITWSVTKIYSRLSHAMKKKISLDLLTSNPHTLLPFEPLLLPLPTLQSLIINEETYDLIKFKPGTNELEVQCVGH